MAEEVEKVLKPSIRNAFKSLHIDRGVEDFTAISLGIDPIYKAVKSMHAVLRKEQTPEDAAELPDRIVDHIKKLAKDGIIKQGAAQLLLTIAPILATIFTVGNLATISTERPIIQPARKFFRPTLLQDPNYITGLFRKLISEGDLNEVFARKGYSVKDIDLLVKTSLAIPSVRDIITFAVREVYSPEIAERFGQFEGVGAVLANARDDLKAAGMTEGLFTKYWAAHWILPSTLQAFEMLHRGIITDTDLDMLFKAADVMPFWRDKLKAISFVPYTRVDVRRMHKLGILSRDQVRKAYKDIGFDDVKSENMTKFTEEYNADPEESDLTELDKEVIRQKDLTKADILRGYTNGLITPGKAKEYLTALGYQAWELDYYISREDYLQEEKETDTILKFYKEAYIKGVWNKTEIAIKFGELNLPANYQEYLLKIWDLELLVKPQMPTKSEVLGFYKKDIINEETVRTQLRMLGYAEKYVDWYIKAVGKGAEVE